MTFASFNELVEYFIEHYGVMETTVIYYQSTDKVGVIAMIGNDTKLYNGGLLVYKGRLNHNQFTLIENEYSRSASREYFSYVRDICESLEVQFKQDAVASDLGIDLD